MRIISEKHIKTLIKERPASLHKGDCGKVAIVAGSRGMAGAAVFTGKAAVRTGAGLTRYCVPEEIFDVLQISVPEATCLVRTEDLSALSDLSDYDSMAMGPGMGAYPSNYRIIELALRRFSGTVVLDADGLNAISANKGLSIIKESKADVIITPHPGEAGRLIGSSIGQVEANRAAAANMLVEKTGAVVVLKGHETLIAGKNMETMANHTGTPGMAKGGSGDVLTGMITSLAGQGLEPFDAACAGVFLHGKAGELAEKKYGQYGMTAGDIIDEIGIAIRNITMI